MLSNDPKKKQSMKIYLAILLAFFAFSCQHKTQPNRTAQLNSLAEKYVRLGLAIGQYDTDFVDAYYGPDSLKPIAPVQATFPKDSFITAIGQLTAALKEISTGQDSLASRAVWMTRQLKAFERRTRIFSGEFASFDEESRDLFGVTAPVRDENYFRSLIAKLDSALPGQGDITTRFSKLANRFIIPKDKLDTVFRITIAEARRRTLAHYTLPAQEDFQLEYVTGKPWSGYNWYKGNYKSLIQINTDLPILVDRAIDLACHEGYPGHHVYNMLLEKNLYRDKGWVEVSLYPLFALNH